MMPLISESLDFIFLIIFKKNSSLIKAQLEQYFLCHKLLRCS